MNCRFPEIDYPPPEGSYTWPADALSQAVLCPARRPLAHGNPDDVPPGAMGFVTAHRVRVEPRGPTKEQTHCCYGQLTRRADGRCEVRMASQPTLSDDSRAWHVGRVFRQMDDDPDGLLPRGACGVIVDYMATYPVQVNYHADTVLCKGHIA